MATSKPKIGYHNILFNNRHLSYVRDNTTAPLANVRNWRPGDKWISYDGNTELLSNEDFLEWSGGPSAQPDDWSFSGTTGHSIARADGANFGSIYLAAIATTGPACLLSQTISATGHEGQWLSGNIMAYSGIGSALAIEVSTDVGAGTKVYHTGTPGIENIATSKYVELTATTVTLKIHAEAAGTFYVWFTSLVEGAHPNHLANTRNAHIISVYPKNNVNDIDIPNWYFSEWSNGYDTTPDGWTETSGSGHTASNNDPKIGTYGMGIISSSGSRQTTSYEILNTDERWSQISGRNVHFGAWCKTTTAGVYYLTLSVKARDGGWYQVKAGSYHTGGGTHEWLTISDDFFVKGSEYYGLRLDCNAGGASAGAAVFDGIRLLAAPRANISSVPETPDEATADYLAVYGHNFYEHGDALTLQSSDDNFATVDTLLTISDEAQEQSIWKDFTSKTAKAFRIILKSDDEGEYNDMYAGIISLGEAVELDYFVDVGFDPYRRRLESDTPTARGGTPLGRQTRQSVVPATFSVSWPAETWVTGELMDFWEHAGRARIRARDGSDARIQRQDGLPFFFQWDDGDHDEMTFLAWIPDGSDLSAPMRSGYLIERVTIDMERIDE